MKSVRHGLQIEDILVKCELADNPFFIVNKLEHVQEGARPLQWGPSWRSWNMLMEGDCTGGAQGIGPVQDWKHYLPPNFIGA